MGMAPHPDTLLEQRKAAEGRSVRRITLSDSSSPRARVLRVQLAELNRQLHTRLLDQLQMLCSGGEYQWRVARSQALDMLNQHDRALHNTVDAVLGMSDAELADFAQFRKGQDTERNNGSNDVPDDATL